jgi:hypothetical protein
MCQSLAADHECLGKYKKMEQEALKNKNCEEKLASSLLKEEKDNERLRKEFDKKHEREIKQRE